MDPTRSINPDSRVSVSGGREDCWSEGATEVLVEAWGDRYVSLNRGHLRQKDWKEVADAVNSRQNGVKPKRTDIQCKNRIDTLKKKYKIEKAKPPPSKWPFYHRLHSLVGTTKAKKKKAKLNPYSSSSLTETTSFDDDDDDDVGFDERVVKKQQRMEDVACSDGAACRELARAILKFGEIYERTESCKQQQMLELEKQRMEFTKQIELEKLNMLMDAQLELQKKAFKHNESSTSGKKL